MKLLIYTPAFYPNTGGLETINMIICEQLHKNGFDITLITPQRNSNKDDYKFPYRVIRDTSRKSLWHWYKWSDVYVHSVLSLKGIWPLLVWPKKWIAIHHTCCFHAWKGKPTIISRIKSFASKYAKNIAVSQAVADKLDIHNATVIHNAYNSQLFRITNTSRRAGFVFVGRLVTEKGADLLIEAYKLYSARSSNPKRLTIIGDGSEMENLQKLALGYDIHFIGKRNGEELVNELNKYECMIVPSVCNEAFGIVALEGLACGCRCIVSDGDGLQEAVGSCGILFKKGNVLDLAEKLLLEDNEKSSDYEVVAKHLHNYTSDEIGSKYVDFFNSL